jgi:hypothetical protein
MQPSNESSAATSSRADAVREHYTKVCHCQWSEDGFTRTTTSEDCSIHGGVPDPLDALVAENERLRRDRMIQIGQMDSFEGRLAYARYLRHSHPEGLEGYLALFDPEERARLEAELANGATAEDA